RLDNAPHAIPLHALYQPAPTAKRSPEFTPALLDAPEPLPRLWPPAAEKEDTEHLVERWEKRMPLEAYHRLGDQAMAMPRDPRSFGAGDGTAWSQAVLGIQDGDGTHHKAGRVRAAAYAYDNEQDSTVLWVAGSSGGLWKAVVLGIFAFWK